PIWHREGLRQGNSLSPQLFVLAVDTLGRLIRRAHDSGILLPLHPRRPIPACGQGNTWPVWRSVRPQS
uniref:Reverse transcriptase domain-containing protein n=1 Tax=Aegilops tauschii subsp. strangulata TaxID=200361 RepID=A0A453EYM3_AEGTS